jgi:hypothetical protein
VLAREDDDRVAAHHGRTMTPEERPPRRGATARIGCDKRLRAAIRRQRVEPTTVWACRESAYRGAMTDPVRGSRTPLAETPTSGTMRAARSPPKVKRSRGAVRCSTASWLHTVSRRSSAS